MVKITWTNTQKKAKHMGALGDRIGTVFTHKWGRDVAVVGEKAYVDAVESGGVNPTQKGGSRIKSGKMLGSIGERTKDEYGISRASSGFGLNGRAPRWTKFQEYGTRAREGNQGIAAMMARTLAEIEMDIEADESGMRMLTRIAKEWDSSV